MLRKSAFPAGLMFSVALLVGACGPGVSRDGTYITTSIRASDVALAALAKGDFLNAESYSSRALVADDRNPYALLAQALVYQNTDRPAEAIQTYQTLLALKPGAEAVLGQWFTLEAVPITEIARKNLDVLKMLPETRALTEGQGGTAIALQPTVTGSRAVADRILSGGLAKPDPAQASASRAGQPRARAGAAMTPAAGWSDVVGPVAEPDRTAARTSPAQAPGPQGLSQAAMERLRILHRLYDEKLISRGEFDARRLANLGAVLPLTFPPPSTRALMPAPGPSEVSGRLNDLRLTLQKGGITQSRFDAERTAILDALLPDRPTAWQPVAQPGTSEAARATYARRLNTLLATGLVTEPEAKRELAALSGPRARPASAEPAATRPTGPSGPAASGGPASGVATSGASAGPVAGTAGAPDGTPPRTTLVHLASYRSDDAARQGWKELQARYPALLGSSQSVLRAVTLTGEGRFIRLLAGPLESGVATNLCLALKSRGQYCTPEKM
ncbi:hypothetical protein [Phaeovibrio sulfidiphilus]|nr:hypothetical protein [Phaeovibrio sulfidiphilus]